MTVPECLTVSPSRAERSVDLPLPTCPTTATSCPAPTGRCRLKDGTWQDMVSEMMIVLMVVMMKIMIMIVVVMVVVVMMMRTAYTYLLITGGVSVLQPKLPP